MTYDDLMDERYEQQEREYVAEQTRIRDEARTAFAKVDGLAIAQRVATRLPRRRMTAARRAQVSHAQATIAALGTDGYALGGLGGSR